MELIEQIVAGDQVLAFIIRSSHVPLESCFITPQSYEQQVGFIVYPEGGAIAPHLHCDVERTIRGTKEVIIVWRGRCWVDLYLDDRSLFCKRELGERDVVVLVSGGHGFRMIEPTVLLEVKQGPYVGEYDKERFDPI